MLECIESESEKYVFYLLKLETEVIERKATGREFQTWGPEYENARSPNTVSVRGTTKTQLLSAHKTGQSVAADESLKIMQSSSCQMFSEHLNGYSELLW